MAVFFFALLTIISWGTWLAPSQQIKYKSTHIRTFFVGLSNLVFASIVFCVLLLSGQTVSFSTAGFFLPFFGGIIWALSGFFVFKATEKLGMAKASGIWGPLNIVVSIVWGVLLFGEFANPEAKTVLLLVFSVIIIVTGILLILSAKGGSSQNIVKSQRMIGLSAALCAGFLWGTYLVPVKYVNLSPAVSAFPLAIGIFTGSIIFLLAKRQVPVLKNKSEYIRVSLSGIIWGIGNYGSILLIQEIGFGQGFTLAQLGVLVNGLVGIFILKDPKPKSKAAVITFIGICVAATGGIILGNLRY